MTSNMNTRIEIPARFRRNSHMVKEVGYDESAHAIIALMAERLELQDFGNTHILDVGCGTRFTACMINNQLPIKSYTGVDVDADIIDFMQKNASVIDSRFQFHHWNVRNALYNPTGTSLASQQKLPLIGQFDVIWLFSVFTHLDPDDSAAMLRVLRKHIAPHGHLIFTCRINDNIDGFIDRIPTTPLLRAVYSKSLIEKLIVDNGWDIDNFYEKDPRDFIRNYYICSPQ
jgi:SAM-dependent methyltransferase